MNREWVLFHLREALGELQATIEEIERTPDYGFGEFSVAMSHLYHHLNTAWNARDEPGERVNRSTDEDFDLWRQFPSDIPL